MHKVAIVQANQITVVEFRTKRRTDFYTKAYNRRNRGYPYAIRVREET